MVSTVIESVIGVGLLSWFVDVGAVTVGLGNQVSRDNGICPGLHLAAKDDLAGGDALDGKSFHWPGWFLMEVRDLSLVY